MAAGPEKTYTIEQTKLDPDSPTPPLSDSESQRQDFLRRWNARIENMAGFEARGLARVPPEDRQPYSLMGLVQMLLLWLSANATLLNLAVGLLGPLAFGLGFVDSALCAIFGILLGALTTAYMSIWGPVSGNRTMVVARYFMGYYPSKLCTFLQIVLMVGYGTIDCIIGGQVLSAVNGGGLSIAVGTVIIALLECVIAGFGLKIFSYYERFAWLPQVLVLFILIGCAGPKFDTSLPNTVTGSTLAASRLSFFSLMFYVPNSWAAAASDYYVTMPANTSRWKTFSLTLLGLVLAFWFVNLLGIGLASGVASHPAWADAYAISSGALITAGFSPLGGFGKFCAVVVGLGVLANCTPGTYSAALGCQIMGRWGQKLPRWVWVVILCIVQLVCGVAGRNKLLIIFTNFLALMGYWLTFMVCIFAEEQLFFKPRLPAIDWDAWSDPQKMPVGLAALAAFLLGWVGAVLGMYQIYFTGPLAAASGGADVGVWVGTGFVLLFFPPLRWLELKKFGR
ncbi:Vitamin B6 transporter [Saxophila tyrrhenica]|uniref:Vitamin B6 transporter n=1 Tax=Saxophila tyrrhenica TaxID=1690608 RepID=A0AAV9NVR3_9PEZI|nr:Vitamin B6 transporter [Saxophila tyrrhenica]